MTRKQIEKLTNGEMVVLLQHWADGTIRRVTHEYRNENWSKSLHGYYYGGGVYHEENFDYPTKKDLEIALATENKRHNIAIRRITESYLKSSRELTIDKELFQSHKGGMKK